MRKGIEKALTRKKTVLDYDTILEYVDKNESGETEFSEFLLAAKSKTELLSEENIKKAFAIIDSN